LKQRAHPPAEAPEALHIWPPASISYIAASTVLPDPRKVLESHANEGRSPQSPNALDPNNVPLPNG
jgi:hypothetical protein